MIICYNKNMLIPASKIISNPVLSMQSADAVGFVSFPIVDPESFKIIAFLLKGPQINKVNEVLPVSFIRENSELGFIIDSIQDLAARDEIVKIDKILSLNFNPINLKVITKKGTKLGHVIDYTTTSDNFSIQQIIVKRPLIKSFQDSALTIPRSEIVEITDTKIIVKNEEKTIREKALNEEFVPNFVNPFRKSEPAHAKAQTKTPDDKDTE